MIHSVFMFDFNTSNCIVLLIILLKRKNIHIYIYCIFESLTVEKLISRRTNFLTIGKPFLRGDQILNRH